MKYFLIQGLITLVKPLSSCLQSPSPELEETRMPLPFEEVNENVEKPKQKRKPGAGRKIRNPLLEEYVLNFIWKEFYDNKQVPSRKFMNTAGEEWNKNNPTSKFRKSKGWGDKFWKRNIKILQHLQNQGKDGEFRVYKDGKSIQGKNIDWKYFLRNKDNSQDHWKQFLASFR